MTSKGEATCLSNSGAKTLRLRDGFSLFGDAGNDRIVGASGDDVMSAALEMIACTAEAAATSSRSAITGARTRWSRPRTAKSRSGSWKEISTTGTAKH
ncbi:MAG: hypothetical protein IKC53_07795 [Lentisphaeria bacterium]|nr:hypothetical protein [Lentisphaeria bacterium]MBR3923089.1 hypothetical protein [Kiritimatiellia bacterium]